MRFDIEPVMGVRTVVTCTCPRCGATMDEDKWDRHLDYCPIAVAEHTDWLVGQWAVMRDTDHGCLSVGRILRDGGGVFIRRRTWNGIYLSDTYDTNLTMHMMDMVEPCTMERARQVWEEECHRHTEHLHRRFSKAFDLLNEEAVE